MLPRLGRMPAGAGAVPPAACTGKIPLPALRGGRMTGLFGGGASVAVKVRSPRKITRTYRVNQYLLLKLSGIDELLGMFNHRLIAPGLFRSDEPKPFFRRVNSAQAKERASTGMLA